jgi:hypothetical protein
MSLLRRVTELLARSFHLEHEIEGRLMLNGPLLVRIVDCAYRSAHEPARVSVPFPYNRTLGFGGSAKVLDLAERERCEPATRPSAYSNLLIHRRWKPLRSPPIPGFASRFASSAHVITPSACASRPAELFRSTSINGFVHQFATDCIKLFKYVVERKTAGRSDGARRC